MLVLKSEEKVILSKFLKNEIIDEVEKVAFSKFVNSSKGKLFISNLKHRVNNEIFDTLKQKRALDKIAKMEQSGKDWKGIRSSITPKPPITPGVLSNDAKALFGKMGRKITPEQAAFLDDASNKIYKGVQKLSQPELLKLTDDLNDLGIKIQTVINKLNSSKNLASQQKSQMLQKGLDDFMKSLGIITKSGGQVSVWELAKLSAKAVGILAIIGALNWFRKTQLGQVIQSNLPNPFSTETTTPESTQPETAPETTPTKEKLVW
jgi:hypothetical protein